MSQLTVRRPNFEFPQDLPVMPDPQDRTYSALSCAITIIAPHIERYLIRTMKCAHKEITQPDLLEDIKNFSSQEANHFRNHDNLNELLREKLSDKARQELQQAEADLIEDYRRFSNSESMRFNLVYAEGFESATCALSLWAFEHQTFETLDRNWRDLIEWHLAEEIEHRTVAYDVYHATGGHYAHRLIWGTYAQAHLVKYLLRFARCFTQDFQEAGNERNIVKKHLFSLMGKVLATATPWYSPYKVTVSKDIERILARYA